MSGGASGPTRAAGSRHARRARTYLAAGTGAFALIVGLLLLARPAPRAYTPGAEAATSDEITRVLTRELPVSAPRIRFTDAAEESGIRFRHFHGARSTQLPEDMGSGAAWGDYDGDGDPDLFLVNEAGPLTDAPSERSDSPARSALYRNDGGRFTDVTEQAGVGAGGLGMGTAWGDYDGDGRLDLVVTRFGTNLLYHNNGDGTFTDVSARTGIAKDEGFWTGASWADYDGDGDLDLYICGYVKYIPDTASTKRTSFQYGALIPYTLNPSSYTPERNLLMRNDGGVFRDVAKQAGVDNPTGRSLSASWADFDLDGRPDLYVANDISDNAMYWNRGDGAFTDVSHSAWVADYRGAMGLGIGDWDNDGDFDIFITHWIAQENGLYENLREKMPPTRAEPMHFIDQADMTGLGQIALDFIGWGTGFIDYDNDGRLDLFAANGSTFQREDDPSKLVPMRNQLFWNAGKEKGFFEVGTSTGESFDVANVGRGAAFADYDGDGDVDLLVMVNGGEARLLRNESATGNGWMRLVLRGATDRPPRGSARAAHRMTSTFALGARVRITTGSLKQVREIGAGSSYLSQDPPGETHFGLGAATRIDTMEILWPDGTAQQFHDLPADATFTVVEGGQPSISEPRARPSPGVSATTARASSIVEFWRLYNDATTLRLKGEFDGAANAYEAALAIDPGHEESLYYLGQSLQELGRFDRARDVFTQLVTINGASARGHLALGALLGSAEESAPFDPHEAEAHLRRAHEINGEETGPMVRLGEIMIVNGDMAGAHHWLESAARTNPKSVEAPFLAGYLRWQEGDLAAAREFYAKAVRAGRNEAPTRGVLSEGDRKAPPLRMPMGRTLFGGFCAKLPESAPDLDLLYQPVRDYAHRLARRMQRRTS